MGGTRSDSLVIARLEIVTVFENVSLLFVSDPNPNRLACAQGDVPLCCFSSGPERRSSMDDVSSRDGFAVHFLDVVFRQVGLLKI